MGAVTAPIGHPQDAGYGNGRLPTDALTRIGIGGHRLWGQAAVTWMQMMRDAAAQGVSLFITDSYRTYDQQVDLARRKGLTSQGGLAAVPGTSKHGWGLAVDADTPTINWLRANGARYGWRNTVSFEPWHWEYTGYTSSGSSSGSSSSSTARPSTASPSTGSGVQPTGAVDTITDVIGTAVGALPVLGDLFGLPGLVTDWVKDAGRVAAKLGAYGLAAATGAALIVLGLQSGLRRQLDKVPLPVPGT